MSVNTIILGYDREQAVPHILGNLKQGVDANYLIARRTTDIISMINSMKPDLVILNFRNNQLEVANIRGAFPQVKVPILCLNARLDLAVKSEDEILFVIPEEYAIQPELLVSNVKSILTLSKERTPSVNYTDMGFYAQDENKNLCRYVMELDQKNKMLSELKFKIEELCSVAEGTTKSKLISITRSINFNISNKHLWEDFKVYFEKVTPGFIENLSYLHPNLTTRDLKYCCYLKMNMSNNDIKDLLNINLESVRMHKYRLKKKLGITKDSRLSSYLQDTVSDATYQMTS